MSSYEYASKSELKEAIHASYLRFDSEFKEIDESHKDTRIDEVDKTPAEMRNCPPFMRQGSNTLQV
ncbi:ClbS/DfsB family four-helix bundle protein [Paenibacillus polymyxa]|uniref:ClbS/DfsB family four-helix bundle protein n=1 Tax=Paenibacillus polymyxa TaxID=1406 RepID=UPI000C9EDBA8|nr:ClbS/DfsB family four-helix bundle protein [Paenibacillus polymyxa]PNQ85113.1 hypothetical protein C1T20_14105 [Paenibacillus polymyxa]